MTPPARLLFPAGVTAAHRSLEPFDEVRILGGEPHQSHSGTPNPSSRFGVKAMRKPGDALSPRADIVWRAAFRQRCSPFCPVAPEQPSRAGERRPPSTVRKGTPSAIKPTGLATVCKTVVRLGSTPAIASHRIRASGTDTCRRQCWASPSAKVRLTSEPAKLRTRVDGIDRKPTRRIRPGANPPRADARPSSDCPGRKRWSRSAGNAFRLHPAAIAQPVEHLPRK